MYHFSCHLFLITDDSSISVEGFKEFSFKFCIVLKLMTKIGFRCAFMNHKISIFRSFDNLSDEIIVYSIEYS